MVNGYTVKSLREALEIRAAQDVVPYAGGTDLMVENRAGVTYLFLNKVPELKEIRSDGQYVRIGGGVTFTQALGSPLVPPLMKEAVSRIAAPAIRNAGTFAGNIGNGSAKADSVLIAFAADAKVRVVSLRGERIVDIGGARSWTFKATS
jgi:CO/xanthine dehydrogenase FAD-binding subunit